MQKTFETHNKTSLEIPLRKLENKYPTIPAIEVTIPHVLASLNY